MNAAVGREGVVNVLLAFTARCHGPGLRPVVVEVAGSIDRHLDEDLRRVDRFGKVGELQPRPVGATVDGLGDVKLPGAGAILPQAARADAPHERNVDGVRRISRAHGFVRSNRSGDPEVRIRRIRARRRHVVGRRYEHARADRERQWVAGRVGDERAGDDASLVPRCPRRDQRRQGRVEKVDGADVDPAVLRRQTRIQQVYYYPLTIVQKARTAADTVGQPVLTEVDRRVHRDAAERKVDEIDPVRDRADYLVAVTPAAALRGPKGGGRNVVGNTKRLAEVVRLEEVAVVREEKSLRRRNIHDVAWWTRARRGVRAAELAWCKRVPVNYHRRFAADPLVVNECSG